jgi:hypothetical protein
LICDGLRAARADNKVYELGAIPRKKVDDHLLASLTLLIMANITSF